MKKAEHILSQTVKTVVTILLLALTVLVTYTVILRYVFNGGVPAAEELVRYLFVWSAFFLYGRHSSASFWVCRKNPI